MDVDRGLVDEALAGNQEAFNSLVRRYQGAIVNMAHAMTNAGADADDLAQEVFVRAWRSLKGFRAEATFKTWLYGIAINVIRTHRSRSARLRRLFWSAPADDPEAGDPLDRVAVEDGIEAPLLMRQQIDRALASLSQELREALVLRDVQGLEYREIADTLGVPIGTVESRIFRARKQLRPLLESLRHR